MGQTPSAGRGVCLGGEERASSVTSGGGHRCTELCKSVVVKWGHSLLDGFLREIGGKILCWDWRNYRRGQER